MAEPEVLEAPNILEYPYSRSVGPIIGRFMTSLRDGHFCGIRTNDGRVLCPPTEYDPATGEELHEFVDVGPGGVVTTWAWVNAPRAKHPLDRPFAWALVRLDGADTALLHVLQGVEPTAVRRGLRVRGDLAETRRGHITDLDGFRPL